MLTKLTAGCLAALALVAAPAAAQGTFPEQPVRIVLGQAAGGGADLIARTIAQRISEPLGQQVVVENRTGAAGTIAAAYVANQPPDGYTMLLGGGSLVLAAAMQADPGFDILESFTPVANINLTPLALIAAPDFEADNLDELIELAREAPGEYFYATPGVGSVMHLVMEMLAAEAGIELQDVPFQGAAPSIAALMAGELPLAMLSLAGVAEQERAGNVKVIAIHAPDRLDEFPDFPTIAETIEGFDVVPGNFLLAPAGTPDEIVQTLSDAVGEAMNDPEIQNFFRQQGLVPAYMSAQEFAEVLPRDVATWTEAARNLEPADN